MVSISVSHAFRHLKWTFDEWPKKFCPIVQQYVQSKILYYQDDFLIDDNDPLRRFHSTLLFCFSSNGLSKSDHQLGKIHSSANYQDECFGCRDQLPLLLFFLRKGCIMPWEDCMPFWNSLPPSPTSIHPITPPLRHSIESIISHLTPLSLFVDASKNEAILFSDQHVLWTFSRYFEINDGGSTYREAFALQLSLRYIPENLLPSSSLWTPTTSDYFMLY